MFIANMIAIDANYIDAMAPNASAIKNARKLVDSGKLYDLYKSQDGSLLFGKCKGSGKNPYSPSVDFGDPSKPVPRCTCPSRQFPCKHALALLYAWVLDPAAFKEAEVPADLAEKREKAAKRAEKKKETAGQPPKPRKVNTSALKKKLGVQLKALELLEALMHGMLSRGLGTHGHKEASDLEEKAAQLRAAYLPGAELAILRLSDTLFNATRDNSDKSIDSPMAWKAMDELSRLEALVRRGKKYLEDRANDTELKPDADSGIAAWLGHAWRFDGLQEAGLGEKEAEFIQLAFLLLDDPVKREYADTGIWFNLASQQLFLTENLRPHRATGHIKGEDSFYSVAKVQEFVRYPGEMPQRIRWQAMEPRDISAGDYAQVVSASASDFEPVLKSIRAAMKLPLRPQLPLALVKPTRIGVVKDGGKTQYLIEDEKGVRIELADIQDGQLGIPSTCNLLPLLGKQTEGAALLCLFHLDLSTLRLAAQPLSFIQGNSITRLAY